MCSAKKPIGLTAAEAVELMRVRDAPTKKLASVHGQNDTASGLRVRELIRSGKLAAKSIITVFSNFNRDPGNIPPQA